MLHVMVMVISLVMVIKMTALMVVNFTVLKVFFLAKTQINNQSLDFGDSEFMTITAIRTVDMAAFSELIFYVGELISQPSFKGICWFQVHHQAHDWKLCKDSHFTFLHRDGNLHGCHCDSLFVKTSSQHPINGTCWLKMHVKVLTTRCASKILATFISLD